MFNELLMSVELGLIFAVAAVGIYVTFRIIDFPDLTCDGSVVLGAAIASVLIKAGCGPCLATLAALPAGGLAGAATGVLYTRCNVTKLLSGILMGFMLYSINLRVMGGYPNLAVLEYPTLLSEWSVGRLLVINLLVCSVLGWLWMTDFGLSLRTLGQNKQLAHHSGVKVSTMTLAGLALSNALIALSGALLSQYQGFADVNSGSGTLIFGLASIMIGEKLCFPRTVTWGSVRCVVGAILYRVLLSAALYSDRLGLATQDLPLISGVMVVGMMGMSRRSRC